MWQVPALVGLGVIGLVVIFFDPPPSKEAIERRQRIKEKARKFFLDQLPEELMSEFEKKGRLTIRSKYRNGRVYELHGDSSIYQVDGKSRRRLCINFSQVLPAEDKVLTVLRSIQADEKGFLRSIGQTA